MAKIRHPGPVIFEEIITPRGLTISDVARILRVDRGTLSRVLNENFPLSWNMAMRFNRAFGIAMGPYLRMQLEWDLRKKRVAPFGIKRYVPPEPASKAESESDLVLA